MYIYDLDDPLAREALADLDNVSTAACVRILHLRPYVDSTEHRQKQKKQQQRSWTDFRSRLRASHDRTSGRKSSSKRRTNALLGNLRNLKNLEYFDLHCHLDDDVDAFRRTIPPIRASWASYIGSLRRMTLKIPLECYNALLSSSTLFPRLTELSLHIFASDYSTNPVDPMCTDLAPFINRHVHSLESLTVITPETGTADLSPMFFNLRFFPRLTKLHLIFCALSLEYINLTGIHEFFSAHCNQLQDLLLHFNRMVGLKPQTFLSETFFQLPVFRVPLPVLESLDVGFTGFRDSSGQGTITYVHQFRGNLKRVLLNHTQLSIGNVTRLTDGFWNLRYLEIFVYHLNPALLDLLSSRLTQLVDLRVTCICFSGSQGPFLCADDPARAHKWCAEMSQRLYSGWSLRHIRLDILSDTAKNLALCKRALASALPDVETIDGVGRSEVLGLHAEGGMALSHHVNRWIFSIYEAEQE